MALLAPQLTRIRIQSIARTSKGKSQGRGSRSLNVRRRGGVLAGAGASPFAGSGGAVIDVAPMAGELLGGSPVRSPDEVVLATTI